MDIINLIELLKPQDHLVTVKVINESDLWSEIEKIIISLMPVIISIVALRFSYIQFKENMRNQTSQFKEATEHQVKVAELNAKITTEIEIIKARCEAIRNICVECMRLATEVQKSWDEERDLAEDTPKEKQTTSEYREKRNKIFDRKMDMFYKLFDSQSLLMTYLDVDKDASFLSSLEDLCSLDKLSKYTSGEMGRARGTFIYQCRRYIESKDNEIIEKTKLTS